MLISDAVIKEIVRNTNIHIANMQSKYQTERHAKNVTKTELMAFLGLLFLSGVKGLASQIFVNFGPQMEVE